MSRKRTNKGHLKVEPESPPGRTEDENGNFGQSIGTLLPQFGTAFSRPIWQEEVQAWEQVEGGSSDGSAVDGETSLYEFSLEDILECLY